MATAKVEFAIVCGISYAFNMSAPSSQPIPINLREQVLRRIEAASDADVLIVHEALLHAEKLRLLDDISDDAEKERSEGKWENLPALLTEVRARLRRA
jgi:hypothetical protein